MFLINIYTTMDTIDLFWFVIMNIMIIIIGIIMFQIFQLI
jgi:hypothetical protein